MTGGRQPRAALSGVTAVEAEGRAVVIGEALVDVVTHSDGRVREHPGGSPANVAVALARLGRRTTLVTQYADDHYGSVLDAHLRSEGVEPLVQAPVRGRSSSARARLASGGAASYEFDLAWDLTPCALPEDAGVVHTGSLAAVLEPGADGVAAMLDALDGRATVSYDLNLRPGAVGRGSDVSDRVLSLVARSDLVKASDEDLAHLHPDLTPVEAARQLFALGPAAVVVTLGARGAFCIAGNAEVEVAAPAVAVADTIGAGDAFCAAMVDRIWTLGLVGETARERLRAMDAESWTEVLGRAVVAAAIAVTRPGADPPTRADLTERVSGGPS